MPGPRFNTRSKLGHFLQNVMTISEIDSLVSSIRKKYRIDRTHVHHNKHIKYALLLIKSTTRAFVCITHSRFVTGFQMIDT